MRASRILFLPLVMVFCSLNPAAHSDGTGTDGFGSLREAVEGAVAIVRPALVRIHVVEAYYQEGRELKYELSGSGAVITPEGHVITNHHVAGHAKLIICTFANKEEVEAELVGSDPLTDIAVLKLPTDDGQKYAVAPFGDSSKVLVGDNVLAMGSPLALAQSVTLGIVSITDMILPESERRGGGIRQDGEDVGALVRWIGHDAAIYPGNSGGPLVNLSGEIVGINEIGYGLSGAIPGNLAKQVADDIIAHGSVRRAWLGVEVQPRLKHGNADSGVLIGGILEGSPADKAGLKAGDKLIELAGTPVDVRFAEQLPDFNRLAAGLEIETPVEVRVLRDGEEKTLSLTPELREPREPQEYELKQWGITVRDLSYLLAREQKRENTDAVLVTSVGTGGPSGSAKPEIREKDFIVAVAGKPTPSVAALREITEELTKDAAEPVPVLVEYERKTEKYVTVVEVGIKELPDPSLEVKKAWLPVETQVLTRDLAELMGNPDMTGFRITHVYKSSTADKAGLEVGDLILAVDGEPMTASALEHYEELEAWIRQYRVGTATVLDVRRGDEPLKVEVELVKAPPEAREMKRYRNDDFEFTVRDITFFDKAEEQWGEEQQGVMVEQVKSGGWAALGHLDNGNLILEVDGQSIPDVDTLEQIMDRVASEKEKAVVFKVLKGIHTAYIELEPKWDSR